jgi:hypothetical protein
VSLVDVERLREIAKVAFADILTDASIVDVWFSLKLQGRYSFHWERRTLDGKIYC